MYVEMEDSPVIDRRGQGYRTQRDALDAIED